MYREIRKWSNAKKANYNGNIYDSRFEASYAKTLNILQNAGQIVSYERQVIIPLIVNNYKVCDYKIDFIVNHLDGITEYVEVKGIAFPEWRLKFKLFEALYSDKNNVKITVVKQKNNWFMRKLKKVKNGR